MAEDASFHGLICRARAGDTNAADELVRQYEPAVRRAVRFCSRDSRLRREFDTTDVFQSVMGSFFFRTKLGQFQLDTPEHLIKLLTTMARNKVAKAANRGRTQARDRSRVTGGSAEAEATPARASSPADQVSAKETLRETFRRLTPEERRLVKLRLGDRSWAEIAAAIGDTPKAVRKRHDRAVARVAKELGLDE